MPKDKLILSEHYFYEYTLKRLDSRLRVCRRTLYQISKQGKLDGPDRRLMVDGHEVALAYMRVGLKPEHYTDSSEWEARLLIERSFAIKSPTIGYHLAGWKKIQQLLAQPGVLERFLTPRDSNKLRKFFTGSCSIITFTC